MKNRPLFIGVHPDYAWRIDAEIHAWLAQPETRVADSLTALIVFVKTAIH